MTQCASHDNLDPILERTGAACSPTPAVKTSPSMPPMTVASSATMRAQCRLKESRASFAAGLSLARSSRTSLLIPDKPFRPQS